MGPGVIVHPAPSLGGPGLRFKFIFSEFEAAKIGYSSYNKLSFDRLYMFLDINKKIMVLVD